MKPLTWKPCENLSRTWVRPTIFPTNNVIALSYLCIFINNTLEIVTPILMLLKPSKTYLFVSESLRSNSRICLQFLTHIWNSSSYQGFDCLTLLMYIFKEYIRHRNSIISITKTLILVSKSWIEVRCMVSLSFDGIDGIDGRSLTPQLQTHLLLRQTMPCTEKEWARRKKRYELWVLLQCAAFPSWTQIITVT